MTCDLTVSELFQAYYDCRKMKRNTWNALLFEQNLERNLMDLYYELVSGEYSPGRSIMFVITRPKPREVWAADFRDRVVHHVLYNRYSEHFYKRFIHDSYACIPEKGTLRAAQRVQHFIRSATKNHTAPAWYLKADISNFFVSINKQVLDSLLSKHITDPWWMQLTRTILHNDPTDNVYIKSPKSLLDKVPYQKSLLNAKFGFGLPIGNLSSQFFANVYLNELDQYVKHVLKARYYVRYVDDVVVICDSQKTPSIIYDQMNDFAKNTLEVVFHPNKKEINAVDVGINFVGYIIRPNCKYVRRSTIENMYSRIKQINNFDEMQSSVNSYFGIMKHSNSFSERVKVTSLLNDKNYWVNSQYSKLIKQG